MLCLHYVYVTTSLYRYLSRVVLIPFTDKKGDVSPSDRFQLDQQLMHAMNNASGAAPLLIKLRKGILSQEEFLTIIEKVSSILPPSAPQRLHRIILTFGLFNIQSKS